MLAIPIAAIATQAAWLAALQLIKALKQGAALSVPLAALAKGLALDRFHVSQFAASSAPAYLKGMAQAVELLQADPAEDNRMQALSLLTEGAKALMAAHPNEYNPVAFQAIMDLPVLVDTSTSTASAPS